jgi:hypothetical protein
MSAPFTPAGEWVDACGFRRCTVSVDPAAGMYPAMVVLDEVELAGSMLPGCARELAACLVAAADEAERGSQG